MPCMQLSGTVYAQGHSRKAHHCIQPSGSSSCSPQKAHQQRAQFARERTGMQLAYRIMGQRSDSLWEAAAGAISSDSPKNLLQEWTHSHGLPLPKYRTWKSGGAVHKPSFKASCKVSNQTFHSTQKLQTKREAEREVAQTALTTLQSLEKAKKKEECGDTASDLMSRGKLSQKLIVIVDADNVDVPIDLMNQTVASFLFFVARNGTKNVSRFKACANAIIFPTPCVGRNATDIYLTYKTSSVRALFPDADMGIYTQDHFGQTLATISQSTHLTDVGQLREWVAARKIQEM